MPVFFLKSPQNRTIPGSSSTLEDDVIIEILARLPPRSLLRFRAVSKSWRAIIDSPEFIKQHLNQSMAGSRTHHAYVFRVHLSDGDENEKTKIFAARFDSDKFFGLNFGEMSHYPIPPHHLPRAALVGSCNGLICLSYMKNTVIVWNPWMKKCFRLPQSPAKNMLSGYQNLYPVRYFHYGFGYNDFTNDYNVVRLVDHEKDPSLLSPRPFCEVKIYSLKHNFWRKLPVFPYHFSHESSAAVAGVFAHSSLHWIVKDNSIAAIDIKTEEYRLISPPKFTFVELYDFELGALNGCLCLSPSVFCNQVLPSKSAGIPLWVMKDYGIQDSWTKMIVQVPTGYGYTLIKPIRYCVRNQEMVWQNSGEEFQLFHIKEQRVVKTAKVADSAVILEGYQCVGSLVQPFGGYGGESKMIKRKRAAI